MIHAKSDSDMTSSVPSSPGSPKRPLYFVQSPSRDSHDGDKSSSVHATPASNTPVDSPSHPSYSRHSRSSSASRFSGAFRSSLGRKGGRKHNHKGWPECGVIEEEGDYDEIYGDKGFSRRLQILIALLSFTSVFSMFCLIIWGASRPFKAEISVKSMTVHDIYFGQGSDPTGVPTKLATVNCSARMTVHNPATFFGIHVSSSPLSLMFAEIVVATGQMKKYYQGRKSQRSWTVNITGNKVPLYGAGASLDDSGGGVPMTLVFKVYSTGNVVGKLVKSRHQRHISCSFDINTRSSDPIQLKEDSCNYF